MPTFYQDNELEIDVEEFVDSCSEREKQQLIEYLKVDLTDAPLSEWDKLVSKLMGMGQHRLSVEEEELIRKIAEKL